MIVKLKNYTGGYRVLSLAKDEETKHKLLDAALDTLTYDERQCTILPENVSFEITVEEYEALNGCCNFDVLELDERGNAYRYYNNDSVDNAILVTNRCNSNRIAAVSFFRSDSL